MPEAIEFSINEEHDPHSNTEFSIRLLLAPADPTALNPHETRPLASIQDLGTFESRDYSLFNSRSEIERQQFWHDKDDSVIEWTRSTVAKIKKSQAFFESEQGVRWSETLRAIGIDTTNPNEENISQFYTRYCIVHSQENEGIKTFIRDIFRNPHFQAENNVNLEKIHQNTDVIEWIAGSFGAESSKVATGLLDAEARLKVNPASLLSRVPKVTPKEAETLSFLSGNRAPESASLDYENNVQIAEQSYFDKQGHEYTQKIKELASQINEPPADGLRAMVCIPVAGHQEDKNIYKSLKNYLYQDAQHDEFEVLLFVNCPEKDKEGNKVQSDKTLEEIERFRQDHPDFPVRVITKTLTPDEANIGTIRKYLVDTALFRQIQRSEPKKDIILISNDADNTGIAPEYIRNFIEKFDANPSTDGMLGQIEWDPEAYLKYPAIHIGTRLFQYLNAIGRKRSGNMPSSGANFAFRGKAYADVNGYSPAIIGEDVALGKAIVNAAGSPESIQFAGASDSRVYTSARRAVDAFMSGLSPVEQWDKGFSTFDDEIRRLQIGEEKEIDYSDPVTQERLKDSLEWVINRTLDYYEKGGGQPYGKNSFYYQTALRYLGIRTFSLGENLIITNIDDIARGLNKYQKTARLMQESKSGKNKEENAARLKMIGSEMREAYVAEEEKRENERIEQDKKVDQKIAELGITQINLPDVPPPKYTIDNLLQSSNVIELGDYIICNDRPLGEGQMGKIVAGYNKVTNQPVAVKRIKKSELEYIANANNFPPGVLDADDLLISSDISQGVQTTIDQVEDQDDFIKIYPLRSCDLDSYIKDHKISQKDSLGIAILIARSLQEVHRRGVLHLDLSLTNILLDDSGIFLTDFGAASIKSQNQKRYKRGFVGGFKYIIPPELFSEETEVTESSDTYELSILLYKLITGKYPYIPTQSRDMRHAEMKELHSKGELNIPPSAPETVVNILKKGIQPNPTKRYQNVSDMLIDLLAAYSDPSINETN